MSSHCRTDSESSYEFVKTVEEDSQDSVDKVKRKKKMIIQNHSVELSFNGSYSSVSPDENNISSDVEQRDYVNEVIDGSEEKSEAILLQSTEEEENCVGDSLGLLVNIPVEESIGEKLEENSTKEEKTIESVPEAKKDDEILVSNEEAGSLQTDPLGAMKTPILELATKNYPIEQNIIPEVSNRSVLLSEISQLRSEIEKVKQVQAEQKKKIVEFQKKFDAQLEAEREKELKRYSQIQTAIRGEWRLLNMEGHNENMKTDGFSFPNRLKTLVSHSVYDFDGTKLSSYHKLCCKTFGHASLKFGIDKTSTNEKVFSNTFLRGNMLITIWKDDKGICYEKKERYVQDGQLYISHVNRFGERNTHIYERVKAKTDILYSIGNASRVYLKFW